MSDIPIHLSNSPEARALADLESMSHDLRATLAMIDKLMAGENDQVIANALFSAALIGYRRCFISGVRDKPREEDIAAIHSNAIALHLYLLAQASKLIAHSVNPFEHTQTGIMVKDGAVIGVATLSARLTMFGDSEMEQWKRLTSLLLNAVLAPRIEAARSAAALAAARLPVADITRAPLLEYKPATPDQAGNRRP